MTPLRSRLPRVRRSTAVLAVLFVALLVTYFVVRPVPAAIVQQRQERGSVAPRSTPTTTAPTAPRTTPTSVAPSHTPAVSTSPPAPTGTTATPAPTVSATGTGSESPTPPSTSPAS